MKKKVTKPDSQLEIGINEPSTKKKELDTYLFQIHYSNVLKYFNHGIFLPVKYIENRTHADIQDLYEDYLILTKNTCIDSKEEQFLIELVLSSSEINELQNTTQENVYLFNKPIPISRIVSIRTNNREHYNEIYDTTKVGVDSYIFKKVEAIDEIDIIERSEIDKRKNNKNLDSYEDEINKFDKILGMLSFMKNTSLYYGHCANFSENYFKVLGLINPNTEKNEVSDENNDTMNLFRRIVNYDIHNNDLLSKLLEIVFKKDKTFDLELFREICKESYHEFYSEEQIKLRKKIDVARNTLSKPILEYKNSNMVFEVVSKQLSVIATYINEQKEQLNNSLSKEVKKLFDLFDKGQATDSLGKINRFNTLGNIEAFKQYYFAAFLAQYGDKQSTGYKDLKNDIREHLPEEYAEIVLALVGIYYGYLRLSPHEEIDMDPEFENIIKNPVNIKFKLDTKLDFDTIETVYNFSFQLQENSREHLISPDEDEYFPDLSKFEKNRKKYSVLINNESQVKHFIIKKNIE